MNISQLTDHVDVLTDEDVDTSNILGYVNDCIQRLNFEFDSEFPLLDPNKHLVDGNIEINEIPLDLHHLLLIPFCSGRVKQQEGSIQEAQLFYNEFERGLVLAKSSGKYGKSGNGYEPDFTGHYWLW
ncbi:hypothetical protein ABNF65_02645 [Paenibacillus larvae]